MKVVDTNPILCITFVEFTHLNFEIHHGGRFRNLNEVRLALCCMLFLGGLIF